MILEFDNRMILDTEYPIINYSYTKRKERDNPLSGSEQICDMEVTIRENLGLFEKAKTDIKSFQKLKGIILHNSNKLMFSEHIDIILKWRIDGFILNRK